MPMPVSAAHLSDRGALLRVARRHALHERLQDAVALDERPEARLLALEPLGRGRGARHRLRILVRQDTEQRAAESHEAVALVGRGRTRQRRRTLSRNGRRGATARRRRRTEHASAGVDGGPKHTAHAHFDIILFSIHKTAVPGKLAHTGTSQIHIFAQRS